MSAARQGSGRRAGRRRRRTAHQRPTPRRGLIPCRRSRIAYPPSYSRYEPVTAGYPGETIPPQKLAVPRRQGKSAVALFLFLTYIQEWFSRNCHATKEMGKRKEKQCFANLMPPGNIKIRRHIPVQVWRFSTTDDRYGSPLVRAGCRDFAPIKR